MTHSRAFVIAGTQRTGTTLLRTSLASHPGIECRGEVFKLGRRPYALPDGYWAFTRRNVACRANAVLRPRRSTRAFLAELYGTPAVEAIGYKLMLNQCEARPYLWLQTISHGVSVIHMTRRNVLKTLVSRQAAATSGVYHVSDTLPVKSAVKDWSASLVTLDPDSLIAALDRIAAEQQGWKEIIGGARCFDLYYEDYVADLDGWNGRILDFIGASRGCLRSDLRKVNPDSLRSLVANYGEVEAVLRGTRYASCLDAGAPA
jgi:LPS sulfotransferase NodH